jgi:hypothetical protein
MYDRVGKIGYVGELVNKTLTIPTQRGVGVFFLGYPTLGGPYAQSKTRAADIAGATHGTVDTLLPRPGKLEPP